MLELFLIQQQKDNILKGKERNHCQAYIQAHTRMHQIPICLCVFVYTILVKTIDNTVVSTNNYCTATFIVEGQIESRLLGPW